MTGDGDGDGRDWSCGPARCWGGDIVCRLRGRRDRKRESETSKGNWDGGRERMVDRSVCEQP